MTTMYCISKYYSAILQSINTQFGLQQQQQLYSTNIFENFDFSSSIFSKISTFYIKKISIFFQNCSIKLYCTHIHSTVNLYDNSVVYITHYVSLLTLFQRCKDSPALLLCSRNYKIPDTWNLTQKICKFKFIDYRLMLSRS